MGAVALLGASGFVGSRVAEALSTRLIDVSVLVHARTPAYSSVRCVAGDLINGSGLHSLLEGADAAIHCGSYVGADEELQRLVNIEGTRTLLAAAKDFGIDRVVYLSTAGVYGGNVQGAVEGEMATRPASPLSASRLAAETLVLDHGGTVVRPNAVVGAGDRWFLAQILRAMTELNVWFEGGAPRVSVVDALLLGEVIAALAMDTDRSEGGVFHVASPEPITIRDLVTPVFDWANKALPTRSIGGDRLRILARERGFSPSQLAMVATDNWLATSRLWERLPHLERQPLLREPDLDWYASTFAVDDR